MMEVHKLYADNPELDLEFHQRMLLEYADLTEAGKEPSDRWCLFNLGYRIGGSTIKKRVALARKLAANA